MQNDVSEKGRVDRELNEGAIGYASGQLHML